jgi:CHAT domain-containing protein
MTERMEHSGFPSDETLAAFIDGTLEPEERQRVLDHLITCDECRNNVLAAADPMAELEMNGELTADWIPDASVPDAESRSAEVPSDGYSRIEETAAVAAEKPPLPGEGTGRGRRTPSGRWEVLINTDPVKTDPPAKTPSGPQAVPPVPRRSSGQFVPIDPRRTRNRRMGRTFKIAGWGLAAAAALAAFLFLPPVQHWMENRRSGMGPLVTAANRLQFRSVEARLSGGFAYRRPQPVMRGEDDTRKDPQAWGLFSAAEKIQARVDSDPNVQNLHELGVANLVLGNYDLAVVTLESAIRKQTGKANAQAAIAASTDPMLLSDLSAAYYARAKYTRSGSAYVSAQTTAERAWGLRKSPETAWNRALTVDALHDRESSRAAWEAYLQLDARSPWAAEAREHIDDVTKATTSDLWPVERPKLETAKADDVRALLLRFPHMVREVGEKEQMRRWSEAVLVGDPAAAAVALQKMRLIADALRETSGERLLADAVKAIDRAQASGGLERLAEGHRLYAEAMDAYAHADGAGTRLELARALPLLREAGSPYALRAEFYTASSYYYSDDYVSLQRAVSSLPRVPKTYCALAGSVAWVRGMGRLAEGYPDEAIPEYERALASFTTLGEVDQQIAAHTLLAEAWEYLDDPDHAWSERHAALGMASGGTPDVLFHALHAYARTAALAGHLEFAKMVVDRAARHASKLKVAAYRVETLVWQAELAYQLGQSDAAASYLAQARQILPEVEKGERAREEASIGLAEALLAPARPESIAKVRKVIAFQSRSGNDLDTARLLLVGGRMARTAGDGATARSYFATAIQVIEQQRDKAGASAFSALHRRYLDEATSELLSASAAAGDYDTIFEVSERLNRTSPSSETLTAAEARKLTLPPTWTLVKFVSLDDRLLIWAAGPKGLVFHSIPVPRTRLRQLIDDWQASLEGHGSLKSSNDALWHALVAPVGEALNGLSTVVLVRDAVTANVPLAALLDPASGRFLFEMVRLANAPSMHDAAAMVRSSSRPGTMLVVGAPDASAIDDTRSRPQLERVAGETASVASLYGSSSIVMRGPRKEQLLRQMLGASGIHFAGHGTENRANPLLSGIVLSGADGRSEILYAHEIARMALRSQPVVVLASCRASSHVATRGLRSSSISDAFLAGGASAVIGSVTPVDDRLASEFSVDIHRSLAAGKTVSEALKEFQRRCVSRHDPAVSSPLFWASFQVAGNPDARLVPTS